MKKFINSYNFMGNIFPLLIIAYAIVLRILVIPLSAIHGDEYCFATVAQGIVKGFLPYEYLFEHKPLGLYYFFTTFFYIFGDNIYALRLIPIVVSVIASFFIFKIFERKMPRQAIWMSAIYLLLQMADTAETLAADSEIIINMFILGCIYFLQFGNRAIYAGIFAGLSVSVNYLSVPILGLILACYFLFNNIDSLESKIIFFVKLIFSAIATYALFYLPNLLNGNLLDLFQMQKRFILTYTTAPFDFVNEPKRIAFQFYSHRYLLLSLLILYISHIKLDIIVKRSDEDKDSFKIENIFRIAEVNWNDFAILIVVLFIGSFISFCSPRQYWPHHFFMMYVPFVFLFASFWGGAGKLFRFFAVITLLIGSFSLFGGYAKWGLVAWGNVFAKKSPDFVAEASDFISQNSKSEYLYVYSVKNHHQGLYFLSALRPASIIGLWNQVTHADIGPKFLGHTSEEEMNSIISKSPTLVIDSSYDLLKSEYKYDLILKNYLEKKSCSKHIDMYICL